MKFVTAFYVTLNFAAKKTDRQLTLDTLFLFIAFCFNFPYIEWLINYGFFYGWIDWDFVYVCSTCLNVAITAMVNHVIQMKALGLSKGHNSHELIR